MKRKINKAIKMLLILSSICTMSLCLLACKSSDVTVDENSAVMNTEETASETLAEVVNESTAKQENTMESAPEPTPEPAPEPTPEPTPEAVTYEGIDMESTLPGEEWIKTFDGIITEPKVVILNDETGKKQIVEDGDRVNFNPDTDYMAVYLPGDAELSSRSKGLGSMTQIAIREGYQLIYFNAVLVREYGRQNAAIYVYFNGEEIELPFDFMPE